jgi:hypothetical protein
MKSVIIGLLHGLGTYTVLVGKSIGKRQLERYRGRWEK